MSRERFLDPGTWGSEQICIVQREARLLFVGIITVSDDFGFFTASPHSLRLEIFPADKDLTNAIVEGWRNELLDAGLVQMYEVNGKRYLWIPTFEHWQKLRYRAKSRILDALVRQGSFEADTDRKGRHTRCWPKSEPIADFRTNGNISVATENCRSRAVPCRAEPSRAVDGGAAGRAPAPPSDGNGKGTAGSALVRMDGKGKRQQKLSLPQAKIGDILRRWKAERNDFRCWDDLTDHAMANADEAIVLAHVLEIDKGALSLERKPRVLWSRLNPEPGEQVNLPSEEAMRDAKQILNAEMEVIAGDVAIDIGRSAKLKPSALKKKEK